MDRTIKPIGYIYTDFPEKFGIPRQSSLKEKLLGAVSLGYEYATPEAFTGIEGFSHLWLIWDFSLSHENTFRARVRPPRLGGNRHVGVFASRSPFRPNSLGLSCVKLERVCIKEGTDCGRSDCPLFREKGCVAKGNTLLVSGIDMTNETPILDIKPYVPVADCHTDATEGYTRETTLHKLNVIIPSEAKAKIPPEYIDGIIAALEDDPRPGYRHREEDKKRIFHLIYRDIEIPFTVDGDTLTVRPEIIGV